MTLHHKEATPDEIFVGNTARDGSGIAHLIAAGMTSARLGEVAYCIDGKPLPRDYMAPLLIGRAEADTYNDIMMARTFGPNWRRG